MSWIKKKLIHFIKKLTNEQQGDNKIAISEKQEILATETPVALVYNDISHTVMMCSPRDLEDFAMGVSVNK